MRLRFQRPSRLSLHLLACALLIICGGILTVAAYVFVQQRVTARTSSTFETMTDDYASRLSQHMERYGDMLYAARALFASTEVDAQAWKQFIYAQNAPERYTGMRSVAYAKIVPNAAAAAYQQNLQDTQDKNIRIHPQKTAGEYAVVAYHEQADLIGQQRVKALGFDVSSDTARRQALQQAMSTGRITATAPLQLVTDGQPGFLFILPFTGGFGSKDAAAVHGYGIAAFDVTEMVHKTLAEELRQDQSSMTITDISGQQPELLYSKTYPTWNRTIQREVVVQVGGRKWQLAFETPTSGAIMLGDRLAPTAVLVTGITFIALSGALAYAIRPRR